MLPLLPALLAALLIAAHFLRAGQYLLVFVSLAGAALFFVRKPWAARLLEAGLALATLEWLRTLALRASERHAMGQPGTRLALILGSVAGLTAASLLAFRSAGVRERFGLP